MCPNLFFRFVNIVFFLTFFFCVGKISNKAHSDSMTDTVAERREIVLWSTVCYMWDIAWQMLDTTTLSFGFCDLATCLPEVVADPGWLSAWQ